MSTQVLEKESTGTIDHEHCSIVVNNDDYNTFEWVIESFMEVLKHTHQQAEQLAMNIHNTGSARVKNGTFEELRPLCEALIGRDLDATIE